MTTEVKTSYITKMLLIFLDFYIFVNIIDLASNLIVAV
jgi:hypothetical protein